MPGCVCAVFENSEAYIRRFSGYIKKNPSLPFSVIGFTQKEALKNFLDKQHIDLLLLPEAEEKELDEMVKAFNREGENTFQIAVLGDVKKAYAGLRVINKYQHADMIISDIMDILSEKDPLRNETALDIKAADITGIYSFTCQEQAQSFAFNLGNAAKKTLYINLSRFSGLEEGFEEPKASDLSDVIYYFKTGSPKIRSAFLKARGKMNFFDVLTSPEHIEDLELIENWEGFLLKLMEISGDEKIIIDMTEGIYDFAKLLEICRRIFLLCGKNTDQNRISELKNYLQRIKRQDLLEKISIVSEAGE